MRKRKALLKSEDNLEILIKEGEGLTVEFKERYSSKIAQDIVAFANSKGGIILLGVSDEGKIKGEVLTNSLKAEILDLARNCDPAISVEINQNQNVILIKVKESTEKPHMCSAGVFKRYDGATIKLKREELKKLFANSSEFEFDSSFGEKFSLKVISLEKVNNFLHESKINLNINQYNVLNFLQSLSLAKGLQLSKAALLFFAKEPEKYVPNVKIHMFAYKGNDRVFIYDKKYLSEDLLSQFNEAIIFCKKHLNERAEIRGVRRHDLLEIPIEVLREIIANAIIHRDYSVSGSSIQIDIFDDRIEISNPGGLPKGLKKNEFGFKSVRRNEIIADMFHRMDIVEMAGSGIPRIRKMLADANCTAPQFKSTDFFTVKINRPGGLSWGAKAEAGGLSWGAKEQDLIAKVRKSQRSQFDLVHQAVLILCVDEKTADELVILLDRKDKRAFRERYLNPMVKNGELMLKYPDKISHPYQAYKKAKTNDEQE